jgi:uncharacterized BrkB/YihY/UPF0761 family membrane protein
MKPLKTTPATRSRMAWLALLLLAFLAGVALCHAFELDALTISWDDDDYANPLLSLLGVMLAGGAASVATLLVFVVGIALAVAGVSLLAAIAIAVGIAVFGAIVLAVVLPLLPVALLCLPLAAIWLLARRRAAKRDGVTVAG